MLQRKFYLYMVVLWYAYGCVWMIPREELRRMYHDEGMTQKEIGVLFGVKQQTISRYIKFYNIHACKKPEYDIEDMYVNKKMTMIEIADAVGVSKSTIARWVELRFIKPRPRFGGVGENANNWQGGISFEPYCRRFNNEFKESVRDRDNYTCQLCGFEHRLGGIKLSIHHVHYDKKNCYPDVVALCNSCNGRVNANRDYWEKYFENQLIERGLYCWSMNDIVA